MRKIIFTRGLIASGKSTWAKEFIKENQDYKRVSRDDFRHMLSGYTFNDANEKLVTKFEKDAIKTLLIDGYNLIIDKQNLNNRYLKEDVDYVMSVCSGIQMANSSVQYEIIIKNFPITLQEAIDRDSKREFSIGEKVIKQTWRKYELPLKEMLKKIKVKYKPTIEGLPKCIICDVDGTLSDSWNRKIFDFKECINDEVIDPVKLVVNRFKDSGIKVIIFSARDGICYDETYEWLKNNDIYFDELFLKGVNDNRNDSIVKEEMFYKYIHGKYDPLFVIDDRHSILETWINLGLFTFNVNQDPMAKRIF